MHEFFKKHGKILLALIGVALMFIWMIPNKQNAGSSDRSVLIGKLAGRKVYQAELNRAANDRQILEMLGRLIYQRSGSPSILRFVDQSLDSRDPDLHLYLLLQEAQKNGLTVPDNGGKSDEINQFMANTGLDAEDFNEIVQQMRGNAVAVRAAVGDFLSVMRLYQLSASGLRSSLPEIQHLASDLRSEITVQYVALDANTANAALPPPTQAELETQFNTYKDVIRPAAGQEPTEVDGHHFPFGYKYPDRVKVEYLVFDHKAARAAVEGTLTPQQREEDALAARQYYKDHPEKYAVAATEPTISAPTTAPASQPATRPYGEVSSEIMEQMINARVNKAMRLMADEAAKLAGEPWKMIDADGYRQGVAQKDWVGYETIADQLAHDTRFKKYRPTVVAPAGWLDRTALAAQPGIGDAMYMTQVKVYVFPDLALHVKEIQRSVKDPVLRPLQVGVEGPILSDAQDNLYVFRVTQAEKTHAPGSLDEVRAQVVSDVQQRKTFEEQRKKGMDLVAAAMSKDLKVVAEDNKLTLKSPAPFTRLTQGGPSGTAVERAPVEGLGVLPEFTDAAFRMAEATSSAPASRPAGTVPSQSTRVTAVDSESRLQVYVMELKNFVPLPIDQFDPVTSRRDFMTLTQAQAMGEFFPRWSGLLATAKRMNYEPAQPFREEAE